MAAIKSVFFNGFRHFCGIKQTLFSLLNNNIHDRFKLFLCGFATGMIVLSKPNFIVYYIAIFILLYKYFKRKSIIEIVKNGIWYIIPLLGCAIFQMWYNYERFGSILEFGIQYQVGANMQMFSYVSVLKVIKGLMGYIFTLPNIDFGKFPFIIMNTSVASIGMNTYSIVDICIGLVAIPILYVLCFKKRLQQEISARTKEQGLLVSVNTMIAIAMLNLVISILAASINDEYLIDVRGLLILASVLLYCIYISFSDDLLHSKVFVALCVITIIIMLPISFNGSSGVVNLLFRFNRLNIYLKNVFEFWT